MIENGTCHIAVVFNARPDPLTLDLLLLDEPFGLRWISFTARREVVADPFRIFTLTAKPTVLLRHAMTCAKGREISGRRSA